MILLLINTELNERHNCVFTGTTVISGCASVLETLIGDETELGQIAKEAADFVLLEKSLVVLKRAIELGRITFAITLKYIYITTSATFGNMFSVAGAPLFMPFLPLLPKQILLINFLSDLPALMIASDSVDEEMVKKPRRWN